MIHISDAGADRFEGLKWANERAGRKHLDVDASSGRGANPLRQTSRAGLKTRRPCGPIGHQLQLSDFLCDRGCRETQGRTGGQ